MCDHLTDFSTRFAAVESTQKELFSSSVVSSSLDFIHWSPLAALMIGSILFIGFVLFISTSLLDYFADVKFYCALRMDEELAIVRAFEEKKGRPIVFDRYMDVGWALPHPSLSNISKDKSIISPSGTFASDVCGARTETQMTPASPSLANTFFSPTRAVHDSAQSSMHNSSYFSPVMNALSPLRNILSPTIHFLSPAVRLFSPAALFLQRVLPTFGGGGSTGHVSIQLDASSALLERTRLDGRALSTFGLKPAEGVAVSELTAMTTSLHDPFLATLYLRTVQTYDCNAPQLSADSLGALAKRVWASSDALPPHHGADSPVIAVRRRVLNRLIITLKELGFDRTSAMNLAVSTVPFSPKLISPHPGATEFSPHKPMNPLIVVGSPPPSTLHTRNDDKSEPALVCEPFSVTLGSPLPVREVRSVSTPRNTARAPLSPVAERLFRTGSVERKPLTTPTPAHTPVLTAHYNKKIAPPPANTALLVRKMKLALSTLSPIEAERDADTVMSRCSFLPCQPLLRFSYSIGKRLWMMRRFLARYTLVRLWFNHSLLSVVFKYDPHSPRSVRTLMLITSLIGNMFFTAFFYAFSHGISWQSASAGVPTLNRILSINNNNNTAAYEYGPLSISESYAGNSGTSSSSGGGGGDGGGGSSLPDLDISEAIVISLVATLMALPVDAVLGSLISAASRSEFRWRFPLYNIEIARRRLLEYLFANKSIEFLEEKVNSLEGVAPRVSGTTAEGKLTPAIPTGWARKLSPTLLTSPQAVSATALAEAQSEKEVEAGWVDAPQGCVTSCSLMLRMCGRHPSQKAAFLARAATKVASSESHVKASEGKILSEVATPRTLAVSPTTPQLLDKIGSESVTSQHIMPPMPSLAPGSMSLLSPCSPDSILSPGAELVEDDEECDDDDEADGGAEEDLRALLESSQDIYQLIATIIYLVFTKFYNTLPAWGTLLDYTTTRIIVKTDTKNKNSSASSPSTTAKPSPIFSPAILSTSAKGVSGATTAGRPSRLDAVADRLMKEQRFCSLDRCIKPGSVRGVKGRIIARWGCTMSTAIALSAVFAWICWCLWYLILFSILYGEQATTAFLHSWGVAQALAIFLIAPATSIAVSFVSLVLLPPLLPAIAWIPGARRCGCARAAAASEGTAASLTARLTNLSVVRASGYAAALSPASAIVAYSSSLAVSAALAAATTGVAAAMRLSAARRSERGERNAAAATTSSHGINGGINGEGEGEGITRDFGELSFFVAAAARRRRELLTRLYVLHHMRALTRVLSHRGGLPVSASGADPSSNKRSERSDALLNSPVILPIVPHAADLGAVSTGGIAALPRRRMVFPFSAPFANTPVLIKSGGIRTGTDAPISPVSPLVLNEGVGDVASPNSPTSIKSKLETQPKGARQLTKRQVRRRPQGEGELDLTKDVGGESPTIAAAPPFPLSRSGSSGIGTSMMMTPRAERNTSKKPPRVVEL